MKLLRNPIVVALLAVAAVVLVVYQTLGDKLLRGRFAASKPPAAGLTPALVPGPAKPPSRVAAAAAKPGPAPAGALFPPARAATYTNLEAALLPTQGIDAALVEPRFKTWVSAPLRDPFLLLAPAVGDTGLAASQTNSPVPTWTLTAIWNQTGSRLAVINNRVCRVGDVLEASYKLIRIEKEEVWFQGPARNERLGFATSKKPAAPGAKKP